MGNISSTTLLSEINAGKISSNTNKIVFGTIMITLIQQILLTYSSIKSTPTLVTDIINNMLIVPSNLDQIQQVPYIISLFNVTNLSDSISITIKDSSLQNNYIYSYFCIILAQILANPTYNSSASVIITKINNNIVPNYIYSPSASPIPSPSPTDGFFMNLSKIDFTPTIYSQILAQINQINQSSPNNQNALLILNYLYQNNLYFDLNAMFGQLINQITKISDFITMLFMGIGQFIGRIQGLIYTSLKILEFESPESPSPASNKSLIPSLLLNPIPSNPSAAISINPTSVITNTHNNFISISYSFSYGTAIGNVMLQDNYGSYYAIDTPKNNSNIISGTISDVILKNTSGTKIYTLTVSNNQSPPITTQVSATLQIISPSSPSDSYNYPISYTPSSNSDSNSDSNSNKILGFDSTIFYIIAGIAGLIIIVIIGILTMLKNKKKYKFSSMQTTQPMQATQSMQSTQPMQPIKSISSTNLD
jgi:hypothetical protein